MSERLTRLREQMDWIVEAPLDLEVKAEALLAEVAIFFEGGAPTQEEEQEVMEARTLITLFLCPFTDRIRRYLHDRLHRNAG